MHRASSSGETENGSKVLRAGTKPPLLPASMEQRCKLSAVLEVQRADTHGSPNLVTRDGKGVNAKPLHIEGDVEPALHSVGMKERAA